MPVSRAVQNSLVPWRYYEIKRGAINLIFCLAWISAILDKITKK